MTPSPLRPLISTRPPRFGTKNLSPRSGFLQADLVTRP